jgi:queuine tRNA-ribosyltransferase
MPVGTQATVKGLLPAQLHDLGAQIILGNTYHLHLRPGSELIKDLGGLHDFMQWKGPILTDSGGFQVFSLSRLRDIGEQGVTFRSHLDGKKIFLGPSTCYRIQAALGSDIAMVLDECPPWPCEKEACQNAVMRSIRWAEQFMTLARQEGFLEQGHLVFGIVQGSGYAELRKHCVEALVALDCSGYAIGGVSVGEPEPEMLQQISLSVPYLPQHKPRYAMGLGTPPQLLKMIALGVDMFDCVMPTRLARHGHVFTPDGIMNLRNERFKKDPRPIVEGLDNLTCRQFSRAYLRHLLVARELLASTLLSLHNLHFLMDLMQQARQHIAAQTYGSWHLAWIERYRQQAHRSS